MLKAFTKSLFYNFVYVTNGLSRVIRKFSLRIIILNDKGIIERTVGQSRAEANKKEEVEPAKSGILFSRNGYKKATIIPVVPGLKGRQVPLEELHILRKRLQKVHAYGILSKRRVVSKSNSLISLREWRAATSDER